MTYTKRTAAQVTTKRGRPTGTFYGDDKGTWRYTQGYPMGLRREGWSWSASIAMSSKNDWMNLSVDGASEHNRGFLKAIREIVEEYPDVASYLIAFDGPYIPVSKLLGSQYSPRKSVDLGELTYYHGTSSDVLETILSDGLKPRGETNVDPVFGVDMGARASRSVAVYLTTQMGLAKAAANSAARKRKGTPVVLEVKNLVHDLFQPDEDSKEDDAVKSLERMGSVAYVGKIRPRNIRLYSMDEGAGWYRLGSLKPSDQLLLRYAQLSWPPMTSKRRKAIKRYKAMSEEDLYSVDTGDLDEAAWGLRSDVQVDIPLSLLVPIEADLEQAEYAVQRKPSGWLRHLKEPIEVKLKGGVFYLEDGHHRYVTALRKGLKTLPAYVHPDDNPIVQIGKM